MLDLRVGIESREPEVLRVALALERAHSGRVFADFERVSARSLSDQQLEALRRRLTEAFDLGQGSRSSANCPRR